MKNILIWVTTTALQSSAARHTTAMGLCLNIPSRVIVPTISVSRIMPQGGPYNYFQPMKARDLTFSSFHFFTSQSCLPAGKNGKKPRKKTAATAPPWFPMPPLSAGVLLSSSRSCLHRDGYFRHYSVTIPKEENFMELFMSLWYNPIKQPGFFGGVLKYEI